MNGQLGKFMLYPDQMMFINAALILLFIPIFDKGVYPLAAKCGLLKTPLQKIITGGVMIAISFVIRDVGHEIADNHNLYYFRGTG